MSNDSRTDSHNRAQSRLQDFARAVARLDEALNEPASDLIRDAAIQRFEFSFELAWKSIQAVAKLEGQDCPSPRMAIATAWQNGWIADENQWLDMLEDRNRTSHTYREKMAEEVFVDLPAYVAPLQALCRKLATRLATIEAGTRDSSA